MSEVPRIRWSHLSIHDRQFREFEKIIAGESHLETNRQQFADWVGENYGATPKYVDPFTDQCGAQLFLIFDREKELELVLPKKAQAESTASKMLAKADDLGLTQAFKEKRGTATVCCSAAEDCMRQRITETITWEERRDILKNIGNSNLVWMRSNFGMFFVFADTTLNRDLFRKDDRLNSKVSERLLQIIRERDPRAYFLDRKPKVIFESNQELEEDYEGNQWHFFK